MKRQTPARRHATTVHYWLAALLAVGWLASCDKPRVEPPAGRAVSSTWQVIAFTPNKESKASGALLLNTTTGETWALGVEATTWYPLHDLENRTVPVSTVR